LGNLTNAAAGNAAAVNPCRSRCHWACGRRCGRVGEWGCASEPRRWDVGDRIQSTPRGSGFGSKNAVFFGAAHPAEARGIEMLFHVGHFHFGVTAAHGADVHTDKPEQLRLLFGGQFTAAKADVIEHLIVAERLADVVGRAFLIGENRLGALRLAFSRLNASSRCPLVILSNPTPCRA